MVELYSKIQASRSNLKGLVIPSKTRAVLPYTIGGAVMERSRGRASKREGYYVYDQEVVAYLHGYLKANGWKWAPRSLGKDGGSVLDFTQRSGECSFVSAALELLFYAPAPYGFQLAPDSVSLESYFGKNDAGFIANHDPAGAFGLGNNMIDRTTGQLIPGFFLWANHTVTKWAGDYYDANYNRTYRKLSDMARVDMAAHEQQWQTIGEADYLLNVVDTGNLSSRSSQVRALDGLYVQFVGGGPYVYKVIDLGTRLNEEANAELGSIPYVGPFPRPFRKDADYTIDVG